MVVEQQEEKTNDFVMEDLFTATGLDAELSEEQMNQIKMLNDATEKLQWQKKFEESEVKVTGLEKENRKIIQRNGVLEGKISSVRIFMQGHLKDFPLASETEGLFKNVLRVLELDPDELTTKGHSVQQTLTPDTRNELPSFEDGSSLGVSNNGAQTYLDTPVTGNKRRQVSEINEISSKKVLRMERPGSSSTSKIRRQGQTRKYSNKSSVSKSPSKIGEPRTVPQIEIAQAPLLSPNSGLQSTVNIKSSSAVEQLIAVESFSKSLLKNVDDDTIAIIEKLCVRLKYNPVALKLAVSYINEDVLELADPLKDIIENYIDRIDKEIVRGSSKISRLVENPCYLTWRATCEKIRETLGMGEKALKVMEIISFLAADNIPTEFVLNLYDLMEKENNSKTTENILQLLERFSIIVLGSGEAFSVHPLIQEACQIHLEEQEMFTEILNKIQSGAHKMIQEKDITSQEMIHIQSIWEHVMKRTTELIKEDCGFPSSICGELENLGKYREMFDFSCQALRTLEKTLGENNRSTLDIKYWKGVALDYLEEYSTSLEVLTEVFKSQKKFFGEEDDDCLYTANWIGGVHLSLKKYDEALEWYRSALEKRERISGKVHSETLSLKNSIALVLDRQGKYKEALELYQQVLEIEERVEGKEDAETLTTKFNMATVTFSQGKFEDTLKLLREVLEAKERVLELNHPEILTIKEWIAGTYGRLGRKEEAVELYQEVLENREEILGPEHPKTLATKSTVATLIFSEGKYETALKLFQEVRERVLEVDHPDTLTTKHWIAVTYGRLGRKEEAVELYKEVLTKRQEVLGPEHPQTLTTKINMGTAIFNQGKYKDALKLFQEVLEVEERVLEVDHPDTLTTQEWIVETYKCLGSLGIN